MGFKLSALHNKKKHQCAHGYNKQTNEWELFIGVDQLHYMKHRG